MSALPSAGTYNLSLAMGDAGFLVLDTVPDTVSGWQHGSWATVTGARRGVGFFYRCRRKELVGHSLADEQRINSAVAHRLQIDGDSWKQQQHRGSDAHRLHGIDPGLRPAQLYVIGLSEFTNSPSRHAGNEHYHGDY